MGTLLRKGRRRRRRGDWSFWVEKMFPDNANVSFQCVFLQLQVEGSMLESLIEKRTEYFENCNKSLSTLSQTGESPVASPPSWWFFFFFSLLTRFKITGIYCKGTFDMFVCWPHSSPGNVSVPCPSYLPWISEGDIFLEPFPFYTTFEKRTQISWKKNTCILMSVSIICRWLQEDAQRMFGNWEVAGKAKLLWTLEAGFRMQRGPLFQRQGNASLWTKQRKCQCHNHIWLFLQNWTQKGSFFKEPVSGGGYPFSQCISLCLQEDEIHLQTALRLISIIGYSLSLSSLMVATLVMGLLRSVKCYYCFNLFTLYWPQCWRFECREAAVC